MLKNIVMGILGAVIVVAIATGAYTALASPSTSAPSSPIAGNGTGGNGNGNGNQGNGNQAAGGNGTGTSVLNIPASDLSAEETAALLFMREEEKLARDVYNALYTIWGQPTFQNIAASEQQHMDQIKILLDRYGLADPALAPGQFTDANLQALYTQLTTQGALSIGDALKVGAAIEEIDIRDLQTRLAQTDNADMQQVFTNLMNGSYNHLQAFTSVLSMQTGETYQPQYLTADQYQSIITSTVGNGNGNGGQGNGGQGNSQSNGTGIPQANITGAYTVHGTVASFDLNGLSITLDDGTALFVQLGNSRYSQSIGLAPQAGEGITIYGFIGDQNLFSAITVTLDSTGQVYTFRSETGQPMWAGGNGRGNGGNH
jgi:hypothetical protein